jgi:hypothetical protein
MMAVADSSGHKIIGGRRGSSFFSALGKAGVV